MNKLDIDILMALNFDGGAVMDAVMWFASGIPNWIPLYLFALWMIYRRHGWKYMLWGFLFIALAVGICDQVANFFKSELTPYLRPSKTAELRPLLHTVNNFKGGGGLYGTVSGHASTTFAIFLLSSLMAGRRWFTVLMLCYTLLVSYSRIYLGVHFPFQIVFGILLGAIVGTGLWFLFSWLARRYGWSMEKERAEARALKREAAGEG